MLNRRFVAIAVMLCAAPLVVTGCGGDETPSADETTTVADETPDEAPVDPATEAYVAALGAAGDQLEAAGSAMEQAGDFPAYSAALAQLRAAVTAFDKLTAPADVAAEHEDMVEALISAVDHAAKVTETSSEASDEQAIQAATAALADAMASGAAIIEQLDN